MYKLVRNVFDLTEGIFITDWLEERLKLKSQFLSGTSFTIQLPVVGCEIASAIC